LEVSRRVHCMKSRTKFMIAGSGLIGAGLGTAFAVGSARWNADTARQVAEIERGIGAWREMAVVPIRNVRRALKSPPPVMSAEAVEGFRTRIKAVELEAERLQQEALFQIAERGPLGSAAGSPIEAAKVSVSAYQAVLRPFPAGPLETIFSAFAKFDPPR